MTDSRYPRLIGIGANVAIAAIEFFDNLNKRFLVSSFSFLVTDPKGRNRHFTPTLSPCEAERGPEVARFREFGVFCGRYQGRRHAIPPIRLPEIVRNPCNPCNPWLNV